MLFRRKKDPVGEKREQKQESRFIAVPKEEGALRLSVFSKKRTAVENITITAEQVDHLRNLLSGVQEFPHSITIQDRKTPTRTYSEDGPGSITEHSRSIRLTVENEKDRADLLAAIQ